MFEPGKKLWGNGPFILYCFVFSLLELVYFTYICLYVERQKLKVKKAIEKGNTDGAQIHAENVVRKCTKHMNYLCLASRLCNLLSGLSR